MTRQLLGKSPVFAQRMLLDVGWLRVLALVFGVLMVAAGYTRLSSHDAVGWQVDHENLAYSFWFWLVPERLSALVLNLFFVFRLCIVGEKTRQRLGRLIYSQTGYMQTPSPNPLFLGLMGVVHSLGYAVLVPVIAGGFYSDLFIWLPILAMLLPILTAAVVVASSRLLRSGVFVQSLSLEQWTRIPYDVLVVHDCVTMKAADHRGQFLDQDRLHGLRNQKTLDHIKNTLMRLFAGLEKYFGQSEQKPIIGCDRFVFVETAWDAFVRIIDYYAPQSPSVVVTSIEPVEVTARLETSSAAQRLITVDVPEDSSREDGDRHARIISALEKVLPARGKPEGATEQGSTNDAPTETAKDGALPLYLVILSHVDCRSGMVFDIKKLVETIVEGREKVCRFVFIINGHHGVGNVVLDTSILEHSDYIITDGNHWIRGGDDVGLIIIGRRSFDSNEAVIEHGRQLVSMPFGIQDHFRIKGHPSKVAPLSRIKACDMVSVTAAIEDMVAGSAARSRHDPSGKQRAPQEVVFFHNKSLAEDFIAKFGELEQGENPILTLVDGAGESGIVVLGVSNQSSGAAVVRSMRRLLAKRGVQGKLLGKNSVANLYDVDRLRFCFHYYHSTSDVDMVISALGSSLLELKEEEPDHG